jgi:hypothetical protein
MFTLCARVIAGLVALMLLLPAFAVRAFCNLLIRYQDENPDIGAFADALTMNIDDDVDEASDSVGLQFAWLFPLHIARSSSH